MVEINNQRKAFLDMLAWSEGQPGGHRKPRNHGCQRHLCGELIYVTRSPSQTCHAKPKAQINRRAGRYQLLSRWWDAYRKQLGLKTSLRKVGRCGIAAD